MPKAKSTIQIKNRRASFDYEFLETYTAGIQLVGTEIKSIRAGKCSLQDAYCFFVGNELFVRGMNIAPRLVAGEKSWLPYAERLTS